ncbi:MAG TPA: cytochrome P450, partial [Pseudonocardia sp.]|nr:cytochrome P450 [Pseudonocardia sp.]
MGAVLGPVLAQGVIARRPGMVTLAARVDADRRAVRTVQRLRDRHGPGPVRLRIPGRRVTLLLSAEDVHRMLVESPEPFAPANLEKRGALGHFQPHGVLISHGRARAERRRFTEAVLDTGRPLHRFAERITAVVGEEAALLADEAAVSGVLDWDNVIRSWWRIVRRVVLGDPARDDHETTDMLRTLRQRANWSYLRRPDPDLRERFLERLRSYVTAASPGSLAALVAQTPAPAGLGPDGRMPLDPVGQVPQWLFAFEPAGMAAHRALALVVAHRGTDVGTQIDAEVRSADLATPQDLPLLRASVLESVRLWPTTPVVLRDTTA